MSYLLLKVAVLSVFQTLSIANRVMPQLLKGIGVLSIFAVIIDHDIRLNLL